MKQFYKTRQKTTIKALLQSVTEVYYKVRQVLQSVTDCYYKVCQVLQCALGIAKCVRCYYKVRQVLHTVIVVTMWDVTARKKEFGRKALYHKLKISLDSVWKDN